MLRQTLARTAWRTGRQAANNASRTFATTGQRQAEVELTIGELAELHAEQLDIGTVLTDV